MPFLWRFAQKSKTASKMTPKEIYCTPKRTDVIHTPLLNIIEGVALFKVRALLPIPPRGGI